MHEEENMMSDHEEDNIHISDEDESGADSSAKRKRARTSVAWKHFKFELVEKDKKGYLQLLFKGICDGTDHWNYPFDASLSFMSTCECGKYDA